MKKLTKGTFMLATILLFIPGASCLGAEIQIGGSISHTLLYLTQEAEFSENTLRYELFFERDFRGGKIHLSFDGGYDSVDTEALELIQLDEAYGDIYLGSVDLRVGQQVVSWGTADGINPTNYVNPKELSFAAGEFKGTPVPSLQATYFGPMTSVTGVVVFDFVPQDVPEEMTEGIAQGLGLEELPEPTDPENTLENMEYALQVERRLGNWDTKLSYFHGWEDYPALWIEMVPGIAPAFEAESQYQRVNKVGLATAGGFRGIGLWGEVAYTSPEEIEEMDTATMLLSMNEPYLQGVVGADYSFSDFYVEGQYIYYENGSLMSPYAQREPGIDITPGKYVMVQISYEVNRDQSVRLVGMMNLDDSGYTIMPQYTYALSDVADLLVRAAFFSGGEGTEFGSLKSLESVDLSIKVSF